MQDLYNARPGGLRRCKSHGRTSGMLGIVEGCKELQRPDLIANGKIHRILIAHETLSTKDRTVAAPGRRRRTSGSNAGSFFV